MTYRSLEPEHQYKYRHGDDAEYVDGGPRLTLRDDEELLVPQRVVVPQGDF